MYCKTMGIKKVKTFLMRKPFFRHVLVLVTGTTLAQLLAVAASPILTRLYSPEEFGLLTVYTAVLYIFALMGTLQYENAIPLPEDEESAAGLLALSFLILLGMCLLSGVFLWAGRDFLAEALGVSELAGFLLLIPFSLLGVGTFNILDRWCVRRKTFQEIARLKVIQGAGMIGTMVGVGTLHQGPVGLFLGDVVGRLMGSGRLTYRTIRKESPLLRKVTGQGIKQAAVRFRKFPQLSVGSAFIRELCEQMPALVLSMAYGPWVVGLFMLVQRILGMPLSLIGYSVSSVYMAQAADYLQEDNKAEEVLKLFWQTQKHLLLVSFPFLAFLFLFSGKLFSFVFGSQWGEAAVYLQILCPMYLFQFLSIPVSTTLYVFERQDLQLIREIIRGGLLFTSMVLIITADLPAVYAFGLLSASGTVSFLGYGFASWLAIKQNRSRTVEHVTT